MTSKSDKGKSVGKANSAPEKDSAKKTSAKPKKQTEEGDDDDLDGDDEIVSTTSRKGAKATVAKKAKGDDDDDDDAGGDEVPDEWEKPEEEEEWDPDFEEFDLPKSTVKKTGGKKGEEDDFKFEDDEFKDLLGDKNYDDDEEDDY
jgi:DNA-directed RNA polymerase subunit delta